MWILVSTVDQALDSGPFDDKPEAAEGLTAVECPIGYPETMIWSPAAGGFLDRPRRRYTFNQWVDLFPLAEQVAIASATMSDPMAKLIYDRAQSASGDIDPADPRTVDGLRYLASQGWVTEATLAQIIGGDDAPAA